MFRYTPTSLLKLEQVFREGGYLVRYEKGSFKPGYCILENKKVIVVNKYFETESRINTLLEIFTQVSLDHTSLSDKSKEFIEQLKEAQVKT